MLFISLFLVIGTLWAPCGVYSQPNMMAGLPPQVAMILQNNPRLVMLARQNPIVAQQIMRNPQMLRDPAVLRAIQSQLTPGQQQSILSQLGQAGLLNNLGRALNPLGLPIGNALNPLNRQFSAGGNGNGYGGSNGMTNPIMSNSPRNRMGNVASGNPNSFGFPNQVGRGNQDFPQQPGNAGYYGNNYPTNNLNNVNNAQNGNNNESEDDGSGNQVGNEGGAEDEENNNEDDGSAAQGGSEDDGSANNGGGEDDASQANPSDDPDIQQLQNFGGPVNDNFPEGLFPPGLLSKEDIAEIRRQQEKQQREAEEKERQQQQGQEDDGSGSQEGDAGQEGVSDEGDTGNEQTQNGNDDSGQSQDNVETEQQHDPNAGNQQAQGEGQFDDASNGNENNNQIDNSNNSNQAANQFDDSGHNHNNNNQVTNKQQNQFDDAQHQYSPKQPQQQPQQNYNRQSNPNRMGGQTGPQQLLKDEPLNENNIYGNQQMQNRQRQGSLLQNRQNSGIPAFRNSYRPIQPQTGVESPSRSFANGGRQNFVDFSDFQGRNRQSQQQPVPQPIPNRAQRPMMNNGQHTNDAGVEYDGNNEANDKNSFNNNPNVPNRQQLTFAGPWANNQNSRTNTVRNELNSSPRFDSENDININNANNQNRNHNTQFQFEQPAYRPQYVGPRQQQQQQQFRSAPPSSFTPNQFGMSPRFY